MISPNAQTSSSIDLGFNLVAGALAGFVVAFEVNVLEQLVWATGSYPGMDFHGFAWWSLRSTAQLEFGLLAAGMIGGVAAAELLRFAPAIRQLAVRWAFSLWVLGSFVYVVFGDIRLSRAAQFVVIDALLAFALAIAAYRLWCVLWGWLKRGRIWRVILAVAGMSASLWWIPLAAYYSSS